LDNGTANIRPFNDINTTGENITFRAVDWLALNITHTIIVVVLPVNDKPIILSVNNQPVTSHYMNFTNDHKGIFGANYPYWHLTRTMMRLNLIMIAQCLLKELQISIIHI
jgi:hypothetical protein